MEAVPSLPRWSAATSCLFLVILPFRLWRYQGQSVKVKPGYHGVVKLLVASLFAIGHIALLVTACLRPGLDADSLASFLASAITGPGVIWLSQIEHRRSCQPSSTITLYLLALMSCDGLWVTAPLRPPLAEGIRHLVITRICLAGVLLVSECRGKRWIFLEPYCDLPPEEKSGILGRTFFWWINPILAKGYDGLLDNSTITGLKKALSSEYLRHVIVEAWMKSEKDPLILTLVRCLLTPFVSVILPRLCVVLFRCSQPILISRAIRYVQTSTVEEDDQLEGYWLIIMAITIYLGLAISTATYQHGLNSLRIMVRGSLTSLIHARSLSRRRTPYDDATTVGLVSTDVSALENVGNMFHETWGNFAEVIVGTYLLSQQVGWLCGLPLFLVFLASRTSKYVAKNLKVRQSGWNAATQRRLAVTSAVLGSMRDVKMLGMQGAAEENILRLRREEMDRARRVRWMMVVYNASANALGMFAPVITIITYAVLAARRGSRLDTETAFTTVAILAMVTHPANMMMTIVPRAIAAYASFERIQAYLPGNSGDARPPPAEHDTVGLPVVSVEKVRVSKDQAGGEGNTLEGVTFNLEKGSVTVCSGPVGGGKTILARVILGEVSPSAGSVTVDTHRIGYCSQTPWLPSKTIKEVIVGQSAQSLDEAWYARVVQACCLQQDIKSLPDGHDTVVGSLGTNLSGGQRQRVALARAVYQRCRLLILDDALSALDGKTEQQVISNLLGQEYPYGLLRELGTTVFWITNSEQYFHLADNVIVLDKTILEQGSWDKLAKKANISKLIIHDSEKSESADQKTDSVTSTKKLVQVKTLDDPTRRTGDTSLYAYYFHASGMLNIISMIACTALFSFFSTIPHYWLSIWTSSTSSSSTLFYILVYTLLTLAGYIATNGIFYSSTLLIAPTSGLTLHQRLLHTILSAPLSYFSQGTSAALNRFSEDIQLVDKQLAGATHTLFVQVFKLLAQTILLIGVQPVLALTLPFCSLIVYAIQKVYLRTSWQLRLLEIDSRSAVSASLLETVQGVETIRAFKWQSAMAEENIAALDGSQRPLYLLLCLQRWLNIALDLMVATIAVGLVGVSVVWKGTTTGGMVGVGLNVILVANSTLLKLVEGWTSLEISLGAVARLKGVEMEVPSEEVEGEAGVVMTWEEWPTRGRVVLENVTGAYNADAVVFRHVFLTVEPGQVTLLCGRTGSGKSSLILSLLRLINTPQGIITVDGVDISRVSRSILRQRCFITVTQDPFFLPDATLRFNLDHSTALADRTIIEVLEKTGLLTHFNSSALDELTKPAQEGHAILDQPLSALPIMSGGQAQLLAMARAILQRKAVNESDRYIDRHSTIKPVILLDEITSSLDAATEEKVYDLVQDEFVEKGHTVIMVTHKVGSYAHRLRWRDKVVWMKDGEVEKIEEAATLQARLDYREG